MFKYWYYNINAIYNKFSYLYIHILSFRLHFHEFMFIIPVTFGSDINDDDDETNEFTMGETQLLYFCRST